MSYTSKKIEKSQVELSFVIPEAEYKKEMENAAVRISERAGIKGFRPGKAPYDVVKQQVGEIKILEEAAEVIVQRSFFEAIKAEKLETVGSPQVKVNKMAPGNDFEYVATVALLPKLTLVDFSKVKVDRKEVKATEKEVEEAIAHLRKMQPKETPKEGVATKEDKLVIDMDMFIEKVAVEGGQAKGHQVYLSEQHYIPGLAEKLVGLKKDETKEFTLKFPKEHYQKHIAGRDVDFKIKVNEVLQLVYPEVNDDFAKTLGIESVAKLKELLLTNIGKENERREDQRVEAEILDQMIEKSTFEEIPQVIIDSEKRKMFYELKHDLEHRGIEMEKYLKDIKKTEEQIYKDFDEGATKRAKAALIARQVATEHKIIVEKAELDAEIEVIKKTYDKDPKIEENLKRPEVIETILATLQNKKVIALLKEMILSK